MSLWCPGDVHARRFRHVGDRLLPGQERLKRLDEELGECLRGHLGMVALWLGLCLWFSRSRKMVAMALLDGMESWLFESSEICVLMQRAQWKIEVY